MVVILKPRDVMASVKEGLVAEVRDIEVGRATGLLGKADALEALSWRGKRRKTRRARAARSGRPSSRSACLADRQRLSPAAPSGPTGGSAASPRSPAHARSGSTWGGEALKRRWSARSG